jgi:hypothetical protein
MNTATPRNVFNRLFGTARAASLGLLLLSGVAIAQPDANEPPVPTPAPEVQVADQTRLSEADQRDLEELLEALGPVMERSTGGSMEGGFDSDHLIPLLAILLIFGGPVAVIIVVGVAHYRSKTRRKQIQYETIARLIEAGRDIPPELLADDDTPIVTGENNLRKGIKNVSIGAGLFAALSLFFDTDIGALGLIFIALGVGQLVVWKLADSKEPAVGTRE